MTTGDEASTIQRDLEAALAAVAERDRVAARLDRARQVEADARQAADAARSTLAAEQDDVRRLESYSPTRIWAALRGSRDADLDRERAEHEAAGYAVARADAWLLGAVDETARAEAELAGLGDVDARREEALAAKERWLADSGSAVGADLTRIATDLGDAVAATTEVEEALEAARVASAHLDKARRQLGAAEDWASADTFLGGGMFTDAMKYERMDDAQATLHLADLALRRLSAELADLGMSALDELSVSGMTRTFDVWFDNIFSDWAVRDRVRAAAQRAEQASAQLREVRARLDDHAQALAARRAALTAERERLLL